MMTTSAKVLWVVGGLVVVVGSFFLTNAIDVRGISRRYTQSYLNPEIGSASKYAVKVLVPAGNASMRYEIFHAGHKTFVNVRETAKPRWVNVGVFRSSGNGTFSVTPLNASRRRNDGYVNGHIETQPVKFLPVA